MKKIDKIISNKIFREHLRGIEFYEKDRKYCSHGFGHLLDVARICYIVSLERGLEFDKEIIYAAALLHDIGRFEQYSEKIPHDKASGKIAEIILNQCGFGEDEIKVIIEAIESHREKQNDETALNYILYNADKLSRMCCLCEAEQSCYWSDEKKNFSITY